MTTTMTVRRPPGARTEKDSFARLLRSEWTKFRTVRGWTLATFGAAAVVALLGLFSASGSHSSACTGQGATYTCSGSPAIPVGPGGEPVADSYYFVHQPLTGNGTIAVRVSSFTGVISAGNTSAAGPGATADTRPGLSDWAKAGLIITGNTTQGAAYAAVMSTGSHGVRLQYDYTHDIAAPPLAAAGPSPHWLQLTRDGDTITAYQSAHGTSWAKIGTARLPGLAATVQAGMFVTSPTTTQLISSGSPSLATATLTHLRATGGFSSPAAWNGQSIGGGGYYPTLGSGSYHHTGGTFTISGSGDIGAAVTGGILGDETIASTLSGVFAGLFVLIVVGTLFATAEYRRGLIRTTLAASPRRGRVLAAKAIVAGSAAFAAALAGTSVAVVAGEHILRVNGNSIYPASTLTEIRVIVGTAAVLALAAVAALALGTITRRSAGAVTTLAAAIVLPYILITSSILPVSAATWLARLTPAAAFAVQQTVHQYAQVSTTYTPASGYFPLPPWAGFAVLCAYTAIALGVAWLVLDRRDA